MCRSLSSERTKRLATESRKDNENQRKVEMFRKFTMSVEDNEDSAERKMRDYEEEETAARGERRRAPQQTDNLFDL